MLRHSTSEHLFHRTSSQDHSCTKYSFRNPRTHPAYIRGEPAIVVTGTGCCKSAARGEASAAPEYGWAYLSIRGRFEGHPMEVPHHGVCLQSDLGGVQGFLAHQGWQTPLTSLIFMDRPFNATDRGTDLVLGIRV
eukprot:1140511-Pelagomonas_calceolata.AAC.8